MNIIIPPHNKIAEPVVSYKEIREDAQAMIKLIDAGNFPGHWKDAFAISHAQVSEKPKSFFVVRKGIAWIFDKNRIIINARILSGEDEVKSKEGCMGFPNDKVAKVKRFNKVEVEFSVPSGIIFKRLKKITMSLHGLGAFIVQHEIDHANGLTIYDRPYHKESRTNQYKPNK